VTVIDGFTTASLNCTDGLLSHFIGPADDITTYESYTLSAVADCNLASAL